MAEKLDIFWNGPFECSDDVSGRLVGPKMALHLLDLWRKEGYNAGLFKGERAVTEPLTNEHFQATLTGGRMEFRIWMGHYFKMSQERWKELCRVLPDKHFFYSHVDGASDCGCLLHVSPQRVGGRWGYIPTDLTTGFAKEFITEACNVLELEHIFHLSDELGERSELKLFLSSDDPNIGSLEKIAGGGLVTHHYKGNLVKGVYARS